MRFTEDYDATHRYFIRSEPSEFHDSVRALPLLTLAEVARGVQVVKPRRKKRKKRDNRR